MRVFVAGASGAIGRPLIGQLIEAGHEVTGMTRREDRAAEIRGRGADCVVCDVFDPEALARAVAGARPEVVAHELTALPPDLDPLGATPRRRLPAWLARLLAGSGIAAFATTLRGGSNGKAKRELGWQPGYPSWCQGFEQALG